MAGVKASWCPGEASRGRPPPSSLAPPGCPDPCPRAPPQVAFCSHHINHRPGQDGVREQGWGGHGPWGPQTEWLPVTPDSRGQGPPGPAGRSARYSVALGFWGISAGPTAWGGPGSGEQADTCPGGPCGRQAGGPTGWPQAAACTSRLPVFISARNVRAHRPGRGWVSRPSVSAPSVYIVIAHSAEAAER